MIQVPNESAPKQANGHLPTAIGPKQWDGLRWEYQAIMSSPDVATIHKACIEHGEQGWELGGMIGIATPQMGMNQHTGQVEQRMVPAVMLEFKRPKVETA